MSNPSDRLGNRRRLRRLQRRHLHQQTQRRFAEWSRDEPAAAANWIYSLETGPMRDSAVAGFAFSIASADPQTALGWIGNMSDESERQRTLRRVGRIVLWRDPANGPALLETLSRRRGRRGQ